MIEPPLDERHKTLHGAISGQVQPQLREGCLTSIGLGEETYIGMYEQLRKAAMPYKFALRRIIRR